MRGPSLKSTYLSFIAGVACFSVLWGLFPNRSLAENKVCDDISGELASRIESAFGNKYRVKLVGTQGTKLSKSLPKTSVLFGFSDVGHAYLIMNDLRLDGTLMGSNSVHKYAPLDDGMLFRFDLSPEQAEKIRQTVHGLDNRLSLTCVRTVCKVLKQGGVRLPVSGPKSFFLTPVFKKLLEKGALDQKTGQPIPVEVYSFRDSDIESLHGALKTKEREYATPYLIVTGSAVGLAALGA
ncbi:MAG: hypothetical protein ACJ763_19155, partial [Bdellovibrionia bacterium]